MMYTLAGLANPETGWGVAGDTFNSLSMLRQLGLDAWFNLGDRDLAVHIRRTQLLNQGYSISQATASISRALGVSHNIVPMSDDPVKTVVTTDEGDLPMQQYFVQRRAEPVVSSIEYAGARSAKPSPGFTEAMDQGGMLVLCPSNPFLSLAPILAMPGVRPALEAFPGAPRSRLAPSSPVRR